MDALQRRSHMAKRLTTLVFILLALAVAVDLMAVLRSGEPGTNAGFLAIYRLPMLFYLFAIWMVRRAFGELARGVLFDQVVPTLLTRVGLALAAGATATVFVTPLLLRSIEGSRWSAYAQFDPAAITLGVVGLMLVILARLLGMAAAMRAELDEIL